MSRNRCLFAPCNGKASDIKTTGPKGIATLLHQSEELGDTTTHDTLSNIIASKGSDSATVLCHKSCYSSYTSTSRHPLFCGLLCEPRDLKKPGGWDPVKQCQTVERPGIPTFKDVILSKCDERQDEWANVLQLRVNGVVHLPAADALYHVKCYKLFRKVPNDLRGNVTCKPVDECGQFGNLDSV